MKTVGHAAAVVDALATLLDSNAAIVRRTIALIERRSRDNETAREKQASTRTRRESLEELTGGVSLALVLGSGASLSVPRKPSRTHPVADSAGTRLSFCSSLPVLGAPAVHRDRACHNAAFDAPAAGVGPSSRTWAVLQAGAVVTSCEEGLRLRADASLLREMRSALRSPGVSAVTAEASLGGSLLDVVARRVSTGTPISVPIVPPRMDTTVGERDTFSRLLCRFFLRYACRLHGPPCRERLPSTPGVVLVHLPPNPHVLASLQAHARTSGANHPVAGQDGNLPPAGQGAAVRAQVDVGVSMPSQSAVRRARLAGAINGAIGVAASACPFCTLDPRRHLRGAAEGDDGWTADEVAFLRAGCGMVGKRDSCRLAAFVPGQTCRTVAANIVAVGLPEERRRFVTPALEDAPETDCICRRTSAQMLLSQAASSQRPRQQGATLFFIPSGVTDDDGRAVDYRPCYHVGRCTTEVCRCARVSIPCEKYCGCARVRWVGSVDKAKDAQAFSAASEAAAVSPTLSDATASAVSGPQVVNNAGRSTADGSWAGPLSAFCASQSGPSQARGSRLCSRRVWCSCVAPSRCDSDDCPCFAVDRECDPDACGMCGAHLSPSAAANGESGTRRCRNVQVQVGLRARLVLGRSHTHGFGVFSAEQADTGDFVGEYVGELVPHDDAHARGRVCDAMGVSFLYTVTRDVVLDATRVGSRMRYVNHSKAQANLVPKLLSVCGYIRVGVFAARELVPGEKLFFDHGYAVTGWQE